MIEIRFHGRGGQGAVTSAELLALSAISEGGFAQSFPSFGPERRGAPVAAFARIDTKPILLRSQIYEPDIVVVLDPTILNAVNVASGTKESGTIIINSKESPEVLKKKHKFNAQVVSIDANHIAIEVIGRPITNTVMLGSLIKVTNLIKLDTMKEFLSHRFPRAIADKNTKALQKAYDETKTEGG